MSKRYEVIIEDVDKADELELVKILYKCGYNVYQGDDGVCFTADGDNVTEVEYVLIEAVDKE